MEEHQSFIEKLQGAPEAVKKRWMIVSTAVIMVVVIYFWLAYFNGLVSSLAPAQAPLSVAPAATGPSSNSADAEGSGTTFWDAAKSSLGVLYEAAQSGLKNLGKILEAPREYIVKPPP